MSLPTSSHLDSARVIEEEKQPETETSSSDFALLLGIPKVSLTLETDKMVVKPEKSYSANKSLSWSLSTELSKIEMSVLQHNKKMEVEASVSSLKVFDNSGDERFPNIFENR